MIQINFYVGFALEVKRVSSIIFFAASIAGATYFEFKEATPKLWRYILPFIIALFAIALVATIVLMRIESSKICDDLEIGGDDRYFVPDNILTTKNNGGKRVFDGIILTDDESSEFQKYVLQQLPESIQTCQLEGYSYTEDQILTLKSGLKSKSLSDHLRNKMAAVLNVDLENVTIGVESKSESNDY